MVVPLIRSLGNNTRLFQKVLFNGGALNHSILGEVDVNIFAKTGGVVIPDGLGVSKCCKEKMFASEYYVLNFIHLHSEKQMTNVRSFHQA